MKVIIIIMTAFLMQVSASSNAQFLTLKEDNISLKQVFSQIRKQTGYTVFYKTDWISKARPINADFKDAPLEVVLKQVLQGQDLDFKIQNKTIMINKKEEPSFLDNIIRNVMAIDVRGRVTDENGQGLAGATVIVVGGGGSTKTDQNGDFYLRGVDEKAVIKISYVGYKDVEIKAKKEVSVQMELKAGDLQEVVVNKGYYITTQKLNTSSISTVKADDIAKAPVNNVLSALQGRVTGAVITQNTGLPGGGFTVQVRGQNAITFGGTGLTKNTNPYFIIDGVPYIDQTLGSVNGQLQGGNPLNFINPSDIESIDILKDADATAIYGSRGANGVILITTKSGQAGAVKFDLNVYGGVGQITRRADFLNTEQYLEMRREAFKNDGMNVPSIQTNPTDYNYDVNGAWDQNRYTDWQDVFWGGSAQYRNAQLSVSGGNTNTKYLLGGTWHRESTVLPGGGDDAKASVHFNINSKSTNQRFKLIFSGSYVNDINSVSAQPSIQDLLTAPNAPSLYNPDGSLNWAPLSPGSAGTWSNPMANYLYQKFSGRTGNLVGNGIASYTLVDGLDVKISAGYSSTNTDEVNKILSKLFDPAQHLTFNQAQFNNNDVRSWILEPQLNYQKRVGRGTLNAFVGGTFQELSSQGVRMTGSNFSSDAFLSDIKSAATVTVNSSINNVYRYSAIYGRAGYNWEEKYVLNLTARRDASSRFGPGKQFANFFSTGAAWIFSEEVLVKESMKWLSFGKLRASYGLTGSDQINDYYFMDLYSSLSNTYGGIKPIQPTRFYNPVLGWESTNKLEFGLELGFLEDRLRIDLDYYRNRSSNQLLPLTLPQSTGFGSIITNIDGNVQNTGWEGLMNTINVKTQRFSWSSSFNGTIARNKLLVWPGYANTGNLVIGSPVTQIKVAQYTGINPSTGLYQFNNGSGGNSSSSAPATIYKNLVPKFYGGINNSFRYKEFSLDVLFQFVKQTGRSMISGLYSAPGAAINQPAVVLDRWQNPQAIGKYQKFTQDYSDAYNAYSNMQTNSDFIFTDASFIRLKNLAFSWDIPQGWITRAKLRSTKLYLQGQNLWTITGYEGFDPETQGVNLPPLRVVTLGIQVGF